MNKFQENARLCIKWRSIHKRTKPQIISGQDTRYTFQNIFLAISKEGITTKEEIQLMIKDPKIHTT